jgi:hypothetical protein
MAGGIAMSSYLRTQFIVTKSPNSDYSNPEWPPRQFSSLDLNPNDCMWWDLLTVPAGAGITLDTSPFTSPLLVFVQNTSTTAGNFVTATFRTVANGATDNKIRIAENNGLLVLNDLAPANDLKLQGSLASASCRVIIAGD